MQELTLDGKKYVSSKRAAEITGYAKDYIGQMCREGRIEARQVGRAWYVLESALRSHRFGKTKEEPKQKIVEAVKEQEIVPVKPVSVVTNTWEAPRYQSETPEFMAEIDKSIPTSVSPSINLLTLESETESATSVSAERKDPLKDLQSAWREWFAVKQAPDLEPEHLLADHEEAAVSSVYSRETPPPYVSPEPSMTSYSSTHDAEDGFIESESVSIPIGRLTDRIELEEKEKLTTESSYSDEPVLRKRSRRMRKTSSVILRTLLLAVALFAVTVGLIGTGLASKYVPGSSQISVVSQIEGVSSFKK